MSASLLHALINATVASSLAMLFVAVLRRPLRAVADACTAYWLWLLVPAMTLAALLPAPSGILHMSSRSLTAYMGSGLSSVVSTAKQPRTLSIYVTAGLAVWAVGVATMLGLLLRRQRAFVLSLGTLTPDSEATLRSAAIIAPMLVGGWRSRLILPADFESRYPEEERKLMLAHERAHLLRHDVFVNAVAAGLLCLFWFNPLMYWAIGRLRLDQELACDAVALAQTGAARQCYAEALLRTQLASESGWHMPIECRWQSGHPLKERITMLKHRVPGLSRRIGGVGFVLVLTASASYAAWAAQLGPASGPKLWLGMTITTWSAHLPVSDPPGVDTFQLTGAYIIHPGEGAALKSAEHPIDAGCTAVRGEEAEQLSLQTGPGTTRLPLPNLTDGQILIQCRILYNGELISTPSLIALDGEPTSVRIDDAGRGYHYQLVVTAASTLERFAAAKDAQDKLAAQFVPH